MNGSWFSGWRLPARILGGVAAPGLLALGGAIAAAEKPAGPGPVITFVPPASAPILPAAPPPTDLASARASALARQTSVTAAVASLQAAVQRRHALANLRVPTIIARDLPARREQADHGVQVAEAGVTLAQMNANYAATFSYLSYLYALEQEQVTEDAIKGLNDLKASIAKGNGEKEKKGAKETSKARRARIDRLQVEGYLEFAQARREEARGGARRAASALREAMGLCPDATLAIGGRVLPDVNLLIDKCIILRLAMERRPEIIQASLGLDVAHLEIEAQRRARPLTIRAGTFAQGSDIHSTPLPAGRFDNEYQPAATGPEYPATINGMKKDRVAIAEALEGRAGALVGRTKSLIGLEADQAYLRWSEASKRLAHLRAAVSAAQERAEESRNFYEDDPNDEEAPKLREVLENGNLASMLRAEMNRARYDQLLALAQLERVTAGGFCAALDKAPARPDDAEAARARARKRQAERKGGKE